MSRYVKAVCPICRTDLKVPFVLLGAPMSCASCGKSIVPAVPVGTIYPRTGYEITFGDFQLLVTTRAYRSAVAKLLARWFDCEIMGDGDATIVRSHQGESLNLVSLHRKIQEDATKQRELYGTAMALWR